MKFLPQLLLLGKWNTGGGVREKREGYYMRERERERARLAARSAAPPPLHTLFASTRVFNRYPLATSKE